MSWLIDLVEQLTKQTLLAAAFLAAYLFAMWLLVKKRRSQKRYSPLTEELLRVPGQEIEKELSALDEKLMVGAITALLGPVLVLIVSSNSRILWGVAILMFIIGVSYTWHVLNKGIQLRLACDGEQYTGAELNLLMRSGAWVFHDIPYQYGNIDHIVVSAGGIFAVETKTFRKPEGDRQSRRLSTVKFDGKSLKFPHFNTSEPIEQSERHAKYLKKSIKKNTGLDISVTPVVALPGWFIERTQRSEVWIINPKRGGPLHQAVRKSALNPESVERVASYIESVARSVKGGSKKMDPDASKNFDFWYKQRYKPRKID
jgi:hypothetical protein